MTYRYFGRTGVQVSPLTLGAYLGNGRLGFSNQSTENLLEGASRFAEAFTRSRK